MSIVEHEGRTAGAVFNAERLAIQNSKYRRVLFEVGPEQIVLYSLEYKETLPVEVHCSIVQTLHVVEGTGTATIAEKEITFKKGDAVVIGSDVPHIIVNTTPNQGSLKMWSTYSSPEFESGRIDERQPPKGANSHVRRLGTPIMSLGPGFGKALEGGTVNALDDSEDMLCIVRADGVRMCAHTHTKAQLDAWAKAQDLDLTKCPACTSP